MFVYLKKLYQREMFFPSFFLGLWVNPFFIVRRALMLGVGRIAEEFRGGQLLDVGCGSKPYASLFKVDSYIGIDLEVSGHNHTASEIDCFYDGKVIPFEDQKFDYAFTTSVFEHVFNLDELVDEIYRVLKTGGKLAITCPFVWEEHEQPYDFARYSSFGITHFLEQHGFEVERLEKSSTYFPTVMQMLSAYISQHCLPKNRYLQVILTPIFVSPINLLGVLLGLVLPKNRNLYLDNIIVAVKK